MNGNIEYETGRAPVGTTPPGHSFLGAALKAEGVDSPPPPGAGRPWQDAGLPPGTRSGIPTWAIVLIVVGGVLILACCGITTVGAVLGDNDDKPRRPPATVAAEDPEPEPELGSSRTNPVPTGDTFTVRDWDVEMAPSESGSKVVDQVLAENMFNDGPPDGETFVMVEVTTTYRGSDSKRPGSALAFKFLGGDGVTYDDWWGCGVIPDSLSDVGEMFPGASASGNVCAVVPEEALDGAVWIVEPRFAWNDRDRVYVATD